LSDILKTTSDLKERIRSRSFERKAPQRNTPWYSKFNRSYIYHYLSILNSNYCQLHLLLFGR